MYSIVFTKKAIASFVLLPKHIQVLITEKLQYLAQDPYRPNIALKKLRGEWDYYRLRKGDYRVVYGILPQSFIIEVIAVAHRKKVYV
jgi:mRNA interferase RelE/StbE